MRATIKQKKRILSFTLFLSVFLSGTALAQPVFGPPPGGPSGGGLMMHLQELNLSSDQESQIRDILEKSDMPSKMENMRTLQDAVRKATFANPLDEAAIRSAVQTKSTAEEEVAVLQGNINSQIRALLTAEQQSVFDSFAEKAPEFSGRERRR